MAVFFRNSFCYVKPQFGQLAVGTTSNKKCSTVDGMSHNIISMFNGGKQNVTYLSDVAQSLEDYDYHKWNNSA
jgi:hypothetical protein